MNSAPHRSPVAAQRQRRAASTRALATAIAQRLHHAAFEALFTAEGAASMEELAVARAARPTAPEVLAQSHPGGPQARAAMQAIYERCLAHHRDTVVPALRGTSTPHDDAGTAAASFLAANLAALNGPQPSVATLQRLERQLGPVIVGTPAWREATLAQRQLYVEKLAILGVLIAESSRQAASQGPAAVANVKRAARGYVVEWLGLNPDLLTLGEDGLAVVDRVPAAQAA